VNPTVKPMHKSTRRDLARTVSVFVLTAASLVGAGCTTTTGTSDVADMRDYDYRERHPILLSNEPEVMDMNLGMRGPALSAKLETAIRQYVSEYTTDGNGPITIQVPTGSANAVAAASTGHAVHYALVRAGVPRGQIEVAPYEVGDHSKTGALRISYLRVKAVVPTCGLWPTGSDTNFENTDTYDLGCASQQNLAAMVSNPADLVRPRPMDGANGARRFNTLKIYQDLGNVGWEPQPPKGLIDSDVDF
jgi:pilus assembly protein CpaD